MLDRSKFDQLYRYCLALCDDQQAASDLLQTTISKALNQQATKLDNLAWLRRIAKNQYIDQYRHQQRFEHQSYNDSQPVGLDLQEIESLVINADELDYYWQKISVDERELLFLWAVEGYTAAELADQLDVPRGTILARLHRTKQRLRSIAEEQCA